MDRFETQAILRMSRLSGVDRERLLRELSQDLRELRTYFTPHIFADPQSAYDELVGDVVDRMLFGLMDSKRSLYDQARQIAVNKLVSRQKMLMSAADVLGSIPKRSRDILIRARKECARQDSGDRAGAGEVRVSRSKSSKVL